MFKWTGETPRKKAPAQQRNQKMGNREEQTRKLNKTIKNIQEKFAIILLVLLTTGAAALIIGIVIKILEK